VSAETAAPAAELPRPSIVVGDDGKARCAWGSNDPEYRRYHDEEWGTPLHGDRPLFEKMSLEGFQAGLSWITILRRRPTFRLAFHDFDIDTVAELTTDDVERLMLDPGIIRNRAKILATIANARVTRDLVRNSPGALDELLWSFAPPPRGRHLASFAEIDAVTRESTAMSKELRKRGYRFVGPTTMYALMQSSGMVDDHLEGCWRA
jgi:DNA-3-methyladenine glycosylase I